MDKVKQISKEKDAESVGLIFLPHPRKEIFSGDDSLGLINTLDEKWKDSKIRELITLIIYPFTKEF